jgi:hypothetical protein
LFTAYYYTCSNATVSSSLRAMYPLSTVFYLLHLSKQYTLDEQIRQYIYMPITLFPCSKRTKEALFAS